MESLRGVLAEQPFFKDLSPRHIDLMTGCATNVRFNPGDFIFREGEEANHFYLLRSGNVSIEIFAPQRGPITIETVGQGDILGWSWLIPPFNWRFDAKALSLTRALALDAVCLRNKCEQDHELGYELFKRFAHVIEQRLQATRLQLLDVYDVQS